ncbi:DUF4329 domain-containing protein [Pseudohalocynthiibacter aestuariivivens]|nr:DUF4329 domain-containing protein [Pseudohalocynthiibacter aestuariivivens]QIE46563.1 DUF4329 domain-containing protein [Pseudohalocynthiibacter aestuariivivens]
MKFLLVTSVIASTSSVAAQDNTEIAFAKSVLASVQAKSIAENREYCGYLGRDAAGRLASGPSIRGKRDECTPVWPDALEVLASWHTHAGYDAVAWSEVPTVIDIEADEEEGIDGYVATPGGRLWYVDTTDMVVSQLCAVRCMQVDPRFVIGSEGEIETSYTYRQLLAREAEGD